MESNMSNSNLPLLKGLGQSHLTPPGNAATALQSSDIAVTMKRYKQFMIFDQEKNTFMSELVARYERLHQQHEVLASEREREQAGIIQWQAERLKYEECFRAMQNAITDNPFVIVLIDGNDITFHDKFLQDGELGGRRAACELHNAVQEYIESGTTDVPLSARVLCRIYADVRALAGNLVRTGSVQSISQFEDFVRGFTCSKALFDFVDVGHGKYRTDDKIIESFKLFSQDFHCRRLLFGCSNDNSYVRVLEETSRKAEFLVKVVLLEGVPFENEIKPLSYNTTRFPAIFSGKNTVFANAWDSPQSSSRALGMPVPNRAAPSNTPMSKKPRFSSLSTAAPKDFSASDSKPVTMSNWAKMAAAGAPFNSSFYKSEKREDSIPRNRSGQRIDPPCQNYNKAEVERVRKLGLCHTHFLRKECPYFTTCSHVHSYEPTKDEIATLGFLARMNPCHFGNGCPYIKCIYGHHCFVPLAKTRRFGESKPCIFGDMCKFPSELHELDTNAVKTLVIR